MPSRHAIALSSPPLQITELRRVRSSASLRPLCHTHLTGKGRRGLGTLNGADRDVERKGEKGTKKKQEREGEERWKEKRSITSLNLKWLNLSCSLTFTLKYMTCLSIIYKRCFYKLLNFYCRFESIILEDIKEKWALELKLMNQHVDWEVSQLEIR